MIIKWVMEATLLNEICTSPPQFLKNGKRETCVFFANLAQLSLFWKNIFPFSYVVPFGYYKSANEGTIKFLVKFGVTSPSPRK